MMPRILIVIAILLVLNISLSLEGWSYRIPILINNTLNSNNLTDYQVLVTLNTQSLISQGKMRNDCGDIRFTDSDGITLLNYWLESGCNTTNTRIWVKVPYIPANSTKTIYLYYGNPNANSLSNGRATFVLFEDWESGTVDTSYWTVGGSIAPYWITYTNPVYQGRYSAGNNDIGDGQVSWIKKNITLSMTGRLEFYWSVSSESGYDFLYYCIDNDACTRTSGYIARISGSVGWTAVTYVLAPGTHSIKFAYEKDGSTSSGSDTGWIDFIRVRHYSSPEPTIILGNEEFVIQVSVNITSPLNQTYYSSSLNFNFQVNISSFDILNVTINSYLNNNLQTSDSYRNIRNLTYSKSFSLNLTVEKSYNFTVEVLTNYVNRTQSVIFTLYLGFDIYLLNETNNFILFNATVNNTLYQNINKLHLPDYGKAYNVKIFVNRSNIYDEFSGIIQTGDYQNITIKIPKIQIYAFNYLNSSWVQDNNFILNENARIVIDRFARVVYNNTEKNGNDLTFQIANNTNIFVYSSEWLFNTFSIRKINVFDFDIYACSRPNLYFIVKDEETKSDLTLNYSLIEFDFRVYNNNYTKHKSIENSLSFCLTPNWTRLVYQFDKIVATLRKDNYAMSEFYNYNPVIVNFMTNSSITVYLLSNQYAFPVKFTLPEQNQILVVERKRDAYFEFIRSTKSDFAKNALVYLRPYDVFYRITVYNPDGSICFESGEFKITQSEYSIPSCLVVRNVSYVVTDIKRNVNITCYLKTSNLLRCDFYALDSQDHDVEIYVYKLRKPWGSELYYYNKTKSVSGGFDVLLQNGTYEVKVVAHSTIEFIHNIFKIGETLARDNNLFYFFLIFSILFALLGSYNPLLGLFGQLMLTVIVSALGMVDLITFSISSFVILFILGIYFMKK